MQFLLSNFWLSSAWNQYKPSVACVWTLNSLLSLYESSSLISLRLSTVLCKVERLWLKSFALLSYLLLSFGNSQSPVVPLPPAILCCNSTEFSCSFVLSLFLTVLTIANFFSSDSISKSMLASSRYFGVLWCTAECSYCKLLGSSLSFSSPNSASDILWFTEFYVSNGGYLSGNNKLI